MSGSMNVRQKLAKGRPLKGYASKNVGPTVTITGYVPTPNVNNPTVGFTATAVDPEQGDISNQIVWTTTTTSASPVLTTQIGSGKSPTVTFDTQGAQTVTASVADSFGTTGTDTQAITVIGPGSPAP
jgi:hypothetical protein